jgi:hypothetical protein
MVQPLLEILVILLVFASVVVLGWLAFVWLYGCVTRQENTLTGSGPSDRRPRGIFRLIRWLDPWYDWRD